MKIKVKVLTRQKGWEIITSYRTQGHVRDPFGKRVPGKANTTIFDPGRVEKRVCDERTENVKKEHLGRKRKSRR